MKHVTPGLGLTILLLISSPSNAALPVKTHDRRGGTQCPHWTARPSVRLCAPSLLRLISRGEDYDGQMVELSGYVNKRGPICYLCPAAALRADDDWSAAVQLPNTKNIADLASKSVSKSRLITIIGKSSASTRGRLAQVSGTLLTAETAFFSSGPP